MPSPVPRSSSWRCPQAILILVEEALEANINSVVIVVSPAHRKDFADIFHAQARPRCCSCLVRCPHNLTMIDIVIALLQLEIRDYNKLPPKLRQYAKKIHEIGAKVG